jgi:hypothetical protein
MVLLEKSLPMVGLVLMAAMLHQAELVQLQFKVVKAVEEAEAATVLTAMVMGTHWQATVAMVVSEVILLPCSIPLVAQLTFR